MTPSSDSCCADKPVSLNHKNKGTTHLADDIVPLNNDAIMPIVFNDELQKTIIKNRLTREDYL